MSALPVTLLPSVTKCKLLVRDSHGNIGEHLFADIAPLLPLRLHPRVQQHACDKRTYAFPQGGRWGALIEIFCLEPVSPVDYAVNFASTRECSWRMFRGQLKALEAGRADAEGHRGRNRNNADRRAHGP